MKTLILVLLFSCLVLAQNSGIRVPRGTATLKYYIYQPDSGKVAVISESAMQDSLGITSSAINKFFSAVKLSPANGDTIILFRSRVDITIDSICAVVGGISPQVSIQMPHGLSIASMANLFASAQNITSVTTGQSFSSFNDATVAQSEWMCLVLSSILGTVEGVTVTVYYRE